MIWQVMDRQGELHHYPYLDHKIQQEYRTIIILKRGAVVARYLDPIYVKRLDGGQQDAK